MNDFLNAQITEHCDLINKGCKPASLIPYQERYHKEVIEIVKDAGLLFSANVNDNGWADIYIFKNPILRYLIKDLPRKPKTPADHFLLGSFFGYDVEAICHFITKNIMNYE